MQLIVELHCAELLILFNFYSESYLIFAALIYYELIKILELHVT